MFRSFLLISSSAGEYPLDKGIEQYRTMANFSSFFSLYRLDCSLWIIHLTGVSETTGTIERLNIFRVVISFEYHFKSSNDFSCCLVSLCERFHSKTIFGIRFFRHIIINRDINKMI